jgi:ribonucleoside-diphosphate reductase alpha chain
MPALAFDFNERGDLAPLMPTASRMVMRRVVEAMPPAPPHHPAPHPAPLPAPLAQPPRPSDLKLDRTRDDLLTVFGKATLSDRYLLPGESFQDMFARVSCAFADDVAHAQRLYDAMSRLWFMPATPVLSNGGADRGLPISCFLNAVPDSLDGIVTTWNENVWLASNGGGHRHLLGTCALDRRSGARRRDVRHHSVHSCHGWIDACDQPGLAAARLGGGLSRHPSSRDRGVSGNP